MEKLTEEIALAFDVEQLPFKRHLNYEDFNKLWDACSYAFSSNIDLDVMKKVVNYCAFVERKMHGRAAGEIEDLVIRYLFRYFSSLIDFDSYKNPCHVEIGTLFGASTIYAYHATQLAGKEIPIVVIDPFEGYYGDELDAATKEKVDLKTFLKNLNIFDIPKEKIDIISAYSNSDEAIEACKDKNLVSILIDGDHSYEGVKNDWNNYSVKVVTGGYALIDDYNSFGIWPDISEFVNKELLPNIFGDWEISLIFGRSLILRKTEMRKDNDITDAQNLFRELVSKENRILKLEKFKSRTKGRIKELQTENKILKENIKRIEGSVSWRITAPLRRFRKLIED